MKSKVKKEDECKDVDFISEVFDEAKDALSKFNYKIKYPMIFLEWQCDTKLAKLTADLCDAVIDLSTTGETDCDQVYDDRYGNRGIRFKRVNKYLADEFKSKQKQCIEIWKRLKSGKTLDYGCVADCEKCISKTFLHFED